jgi:hypothetical protein
MFCETQKAAPSENTRLAQMQYFATGTWSRPILASSASGSCAKDVIEESRKIDKHKALFIGTPPIE